MNTSELLYKSRIYKLFKPFYSGIGHVLTYHRVGMDEKHIFTKDLEVSPESLERTLQYLISRNIDIVTMDECYRRITSRSVEKRFVAFTFDDGYEDNLTLGLPVFEKYSAPFTLFLTSGFPDHKIVLWNYMLESLVLNKPVIEFTDEGHAYSYQSSSMEEKRQTFQAVRKSILDSTPDNFLPRLGNIFNSHTEDLFSLTKSLSLSWKQVSELSNHPLVTIGAHTVNHRALSKLPEDMVLSEINDSIAVIENRIGKEVSHMAYPYGRSFAVGPREYKIASQSKLKTAFTTQSGNIFKHHSNRLYSLPRIEMREEWNEEYLDLYLHGFTPFLHKIVR